MKALAIIRNEHRSLAAVVHGLVQHVREVRAARAAPDFRLLAAMLWYIDNFPEKLHHPKEDRHLFPRVRARHPDAQAMLELLEREHATGAIKIRDLHRALTRYQAAWPAGTAEFADEVERFATFQWDHMRREERELLPLAQAALTREDWAELDEAFLANRDPLAGADDTADFDALFGKIVTLASGAH